MPYIVSYSRKRKPYLFEEMDTLMSKLPAECFVEVFTSGNETHYGIIYIVSEKEAKQRAENFAKNMQKDPDAENIKLITVHDINIFHEMKITGIKPATKYSSPGGMRLQEDFEKFMKANKSIALAKDEPYFEWDFPKSHEMKSLLPYTLSSPSTSELQPSDSALASASTSQICDLLKLPQHATSTSSHVSTPLQSSTQSSSSSSSSSIEFAVPASIPSLIAKKLRKRFREENNAESVTLQPPKQSTVLLAGSKNSVLTTLTKNTKPTVKPSTISRKKHLSMS